MVFIVGAGRSGTTFLSHILGHDPRIKGASENRYIWNYKQKDLRFDMRPPSDATDAVKHYITKYFANKTQGQEEFIVDKTPSNAFRVDFIREIFPDCKIIHILRDGRDNVVSRMTKWVVDRNPSSEGEGLKDWSEWSIDRRGLFSETLGRTRRHLFRKKNVPWDRLPVLLMDNTLPFLSQLITRESKRFGERFPGWSDQLKFYGPLVICGIQWRECVMHALTCGRRLPEETYIEIKYEDLVTCPEQVWGKLAAFLDVPFDGPSHDALLARASTSSCGKWRQSLSEEQLRDLEPHIKPTLEFLGYDWE